MKISNIDKCEPNFKNSNLLTSSLVMTSHVGLVYAAIYFLSFESEMLASVQKFVWKRTYDVGTKGMTLFVHNHMILWFWTDFVFKNIKIYSYQRRFTLSFSIILHIFSIWWNSSLGIFLRVVFFFKRNSQFWPMLGFLNISLIWASAVPSFLIHL